MYKRQANSWAFFSDPKFNPAYLDGGASLTWYLTYSAAMGGSPSAAKRSGVGGDVTDGEPIEGLQVEAAKVFHRHSGHGHSKV